MKPAVAAYRGGMVALPAEDIDLTALVAGHAAAWQRFVGRYAGVIHAAVRGVINDAGRPWEDAADVAQDVFVRLCKEDFKLLRSFDPARASLVTWLTLVARSTAIDKIRRKQHRTVDIDDAPEAALAIPPVTRDRVTIPPGLLTERQALVMALLYDRDLDPAEAAAELAVDVQTIRSTHHKALTRLRQHFGTSGDADAASSVEPVRRQP
jgi:DNA-directed RNA polymerase specialized sigma24 family protein